MLMMMMMQSPAIEDVRIGKRVSIILADVKKSVNGLRFL